MSGFLNIGEMSALALHVLTELTLLGEANADAVLPVKAIAEKLQASRHTLHKVVNRLVKSGMVEGTRGAGGGLKLAVDPHRTSLLTVLEEMEGGMRLNGCLFAKRACPPRAPCLFNVVTGVLEESIRNQLGELSLAQLCGMAVSPTAKRPSRRPEQAESASRSAR